MLRQRPSVRFFEVIGNMTRMHIVVTFLALLELAKNHQIRVQQDDVFDDIVIVMRREHDDDAPSDSVSDEAPIPPTETL